MTSRPTRMIRWLLHRDMPRVHEIEQASFRHPWTPDDFKECLGGRHTIGRGIELDGELAGFMIYVFDPNEIRILNLAVDPHHRRQGLATQMLEWLHRNGTRRKRVVAMAAEESLDAQLFLRTAGYRCVSIERDAFQTPSGDNQDGYRFVKHLHRSTP